MSKAQQAPMGVYETVQISSILIDPERNLRFGRPDPKSIEELKASILREGLHQPVIVSRLNGTGEHGNYEYRLEAGYRRAQAIINAVEAGEHDGRIPVHIEDFKEEVDALQANLTENEKRKGNTPMDRAIAARRLHDAGLTFADVGERMGVSKSTVNQIARLLDLRPTIQTKIHTGELPWTTARHLPAMSEEEQDKVLEELQKAKEAAAGGSGKVGRPKTGKVKKGEQETPNARKGISSKAAVGVCEEGLEELKAEVTATEGKETKRQTAMKEALTLVKKLLEGKLGGQAFRKKLAELL